MEDDKRVFFAVKIDGKTVNVVIQLLIERAAKESIRNFHKLLTSNNGSSYRSTKLSRVVSPEFIIQGGAIDEFNGDLLVKNEVTPETTLLDQRGLVAIATEVENHEPSSEFFITLEDLSEFKALQGRFLVIGKIVNGLDQLIELTKDVAVDENDRPIQDIYITRTGELVKKKKTTSVQDDTSKLKQELNERHQEPRISDHEHKRYRDSDGDRHRSHRHHHRHRPRETRDDSRNESEWRKREDQDTSRDRHRLSRNNSSRDHYGSRYRDRREEYMDRDPKRLKSFKRDSNNDEIRKGRGFR